MRRFLSMLLCLLLLVASLPVAAQEAAEAPVLAIAPVTEAIRPG